MLGRSVRLFLVDGTASGLTTAEIINWTGHVLAGSRRRPLRFSETSGTRTNRDIFPHRTRSRGSGHAEKENKDFWECTCVVTSKDQNITKAHARYLEAELIAIANAVGTAGVVNETRPVPAALPEADESDMMFFVDQLRLILPVLGLDFLRRHSATARTTTEATVKPGQADVAARFRLTSNKDGLEARAQEIDGEFVVLAESHAVKDWSGTSDHSYSRPCAHLNKSGKLVPGDNGRLRFAESVAFRSPSAASAVILGRPDNGRVSWKDRGSNDSYRDWQSEQVVKTASEATNADDDEAAG